MKVTQDNTPVAVGFNRVGIYNVPGGGATHDATADACHVPVKTLSRYSLLERSAIRRRRFDE